MANEIPDESGRETRPEAGTGAVGGGGAGNPHPAEEAVESTARAAEAVKSAATTGEAGGAPEHVDLPDLGDGGDGGPSPAGLNLLSDVSLHVKVELGRTHMFVEDVLRLGTDSVIELDKAAGDPVDIFVNERHVARGEVLVLNESFCVRVSEIIKAPGTEE